LAEALPDDDDDMNMLMMTDEARKKWRELVENRSKAAKDVIHQWLLTAKFRMHPSLIPDPE
jgi:hypothetical protein